MSSHSTRLATYARLIEAASWVLAALFILGILPLAYMANTIWNNLSAIPGISPGDRWIYVFRYIPAYMGLLLGFLGFQGLAKLIRYALALAGDVQARSRGKINP